VQAPFCFALAANRQVKAVCGAVDLDSLAS